MKSSPWNHLHPMGSLCWRETNFGCYDCQWNVGWEKALKWGRSSLQNRFWEGIWSYGLGFFLDHIVEGKGFSTRWRSWMRDFLFSVSFVVLMNANVKWWVKATRGLRQGDPLSLFFFIISVDVWNRMMLRVEESSLLEGFLVGRDKIISLALWITHSYYK